MKETPLPNHLYVHVPFCVRACDYCAFYKLAGSSEAQRQRFLTGLAREAAQRLPLCAPLASIYIGGGTPSFLTPAEWQQLLTIIRDHATLTPDCEFATEANPVSLTPEKADLLAASGINRVTLGLQTFSAELRQRIGRAGIPERVYPAVRALRAVGIDNIGLDLIYGIPGQTMVQWEDDLQRAAELQPRHVSAYSLILEPGTPLTARLHHLPEDDLVITMWERSAELLGELCGLQRYEISNLAAPGFACRHNREIWYGARFVGLGPSAAWFQGQTRYTNPPDLERWLAGEPPEADELPPAERAVEILASGLRVTDGWTPQHFRQRTGYHYHDLRGDTLAELEAAGLIHDNTANLCLTNRGLLLADYVARELYHP